MGGNALPKSDKETWDNNADLVHSFVCEPLLIHRYPNRQDRVVVVIGNKSVMTAPGRKLNKFKAYG